MPMYWFVTVLRKAREGVGAECTKVTVSCRLGACWLYLGYSTTERVLSSVCMSRGAHSYSLFGFLLPHPHGCRTTDNTRTKYSRYSTVCQSTRPFDCVSTLTDVAAPTALLTSSCLLTFCVAPPFGFGTILDVVSENRLAHLIAGAHGIATAYTHDVRKTPVEFYSLRRWF